MKVHTTNYIDTLIEVADDCPAKQGEIPPVKEGTETIANIEFDLIINHPYRYTSDDVLFEVYARRNELAKGERKNARAQFFSKGQACLRASPLTRRYGWGVHNDHNGKVALYGCETPEYKKLATKKDITTVKAMRSKRK